MEAKDYYNDLKKELLAELVEHVADQCGKGRYPTESGMKEIIDERVDSIYWGIRGCYQVGWD
jgi:hypothetical protein